MRHKRARGKTSQFHIDLEALCKHINGCVLADEMIHWCWEEEAATACHRCAADVPAESIECCHNACFGTADPEPAESRWTHVLPNMHARHVAASMQQQLQQHPSWEAAAVLVRLTWVLSKSPAATVEISWGIGHPLWCVKAFVVDTS